MQDKQYFFHLNEVGSKQKREGVVLKSITGNRSQLCLIRLAPGMETHHIHDHEQIGYILSGKVTLTIGKEISERLQSGDGYYIPAKAEHGFSVSSDAELEYLEVFCPPKLENDL